MMYELLEELIPRSSVDTVFLSQVGLAISLALNFLLARKQRLGSTELSIETHNPDIIQKGEKPKLQQEKESLSDRLVVSRRGLIGKLQELFKREAQFDEDVREELEALLISSDKPLKNL
jgi:signal recognition particle GTPase